MCQLQVFDRLFSSFFPQTCSYSMDGVAFFTTDQAHIGAALGTEVVSNNQQDFLVPAKNCSVTSYELQCKAFQRINPYTGCGLSVTLWVGSLQSFGG